MKKIIFSLFLVILCALVYAQSVPLSLRLETNPTWVKFVPKTYLAGGKVGTLLVTVRNYDVYQVGSDTLNLGPDGGQLYVMYKDARGTERRRYLGYYRGVHEYGGSTMQVNGNPMGVNPGFDEQTSPLMLANTMFYNKDTTKMWYFQLEKWSIPTKMALPNGWTDSFREGN